MSTQKWESVTWEWLEREIVHCLLIAGKGRAKAGMLRRLLAEQPNARTNSVAVAQTQTGDRGNG